MRANFVLSEVGTGLRRNVSMTIAMVLTTAISLVLLGGGLLIAKEISEIKKLYYGKIQISIFLDDKITDSQRNALAASLDSQPDVKSYDFESKSAAYERFKELFKEQPQLVAGTPESYIPASYRVKLDNPERYPVIAQEFDGKPGVTQVQTDGEVLDQLFSLLNGLRNGTIVIAVVQAVAALLLISNTIQLAAFTRRTETGIMRLVGASRWYTQLPFILEAALAGLIGAGMAIGGLALAKAFFIDKTLGGLIRSGFLREVEWSTIWTISPILGGVGVALASLAAYITLRLYVRL